MRILKENTIGLVIDIQYRLFSHIYDFENLEFHILRLIRGLKALNIPIQITEQYVKGLGPTITTIQEELDEDYKPIEKMEFSCLDNESYSLALKSTGKKNVIIMGIESHVCVMQTVIDLIANGYQPIVIEDCVSSRKLSDKNTAINRMRAEGAIISSYEAILFELCRVSGTEEFKLISKIVK
ncbi:MAG: hydrolase [Candidatus Kapabacteria bacterium]|nr:hydrolase [Candidatus Kapabacteria bacterium]